MKQAANMCAVYNLFHWLQQRLVVFAVRLYLQELHVTFSLLIVLVQASLSLNPLSQCTEQHFIEHHKYQQIESKLDDWS